ncbi:MAG TPA: ubiquinone/menaquinone biosynthesis methyltransferase [Spirochaetia bacterium]|nr:ubiquinone/menaquinone biosynthesis methyltransferase [Spirochaetia bacterium]
MKNTESINVYEMFQRIVPTYDLLNHLFSFNIDKHWRKRMAELADVQSAFSMLDVCTGTADVAIAFARFNPALRVVGIDFSEGMLERGVKKVESAGLSDRIELKRQDALDIDLPANSYDIVCVAFGLRNLPDRERGIFEMARMARGGGRVVILEFVPPRKTLFGRIYGWYLRNVMPAIGGIVSRYRPSYTYLYSSISGFLEPDNVLEIMSRAGIDRPQAVSLSGGIAYIFHGTKKG